MALLNARTREIEGKLVYYGTALGGKTTNLIALHRLAEPDQKQKLVSLNTAGERTLFFDLLPFDLGKIFDWRLKLKLYTIPGQPEYNETRRVVLAATDAIVFVADSDLSRQAENVRSVNFLKLNLRQNKLDAETLPLVFQYNKRDIPGAMPSADLEGDLNWRRVPYFLASAIRGDGVLETFEEAVSRLAFALLERFGNRKGGTLDELRVLIHAKLAPLYERQRKAAAETPTAAMPPVSPRRVVVTSLPGGPSEGLNAAAVSTPPRPLDTQDLLQSALENEMRMLNEILDRDAEAAEIEISPASPAGLDPAKLATALAQAAAATSVESATVALLTLACEEAQVERGSVLLLTPGDGRLLEAARRNLGKEPLNEPPPLGGPCPARKLAQGVPLYDADLVRATFGARIARPDAIAPHAAVPLVALGRRVGLLVLHASTDTAPLSLERRALVEAVASILALVIAVRALERRHASAPDSSAVTAAATARFARPVAPVLAGTTR